MEIIKSKEEELLTSVLVHYGGAGKPLTAVPAHNGGARNLGVNVKKIYT